ncbi:hypothetical protein NQ317_017966 [Molorchus minor]|uniref:Glutamine amidotransferase domain-containing protein n=1 Tax=Molorchus minor TaxID=1323400 RepID=A0ABQ9JM89_9CUCU|nr:hypothetical protein NQ317_017966 [Molorchus minor]
MQVLGFAAVGEDIRIDCSLRNKAVSLDFVEGFQDSRMFMDAPDSLLDILRFTNVTYNYHQYCLTEEILDKNGILDDWTILSTNIDDSGDKFISSFESKNYPIFGVQFHPEKNQFEFQNRIVPHNTEAVKVSQYFANFFVDECRKNSNAFPDDEMALNHLIYNYIPRYTGLQKASYEQVYVFDKEDFEKAQLI